MTALHLPTATDGQLIDLCGRPRMRNQRLPKEVLALLAGQPCRPLETLALLVKAGLSLDS